MGVSDAIDHVATRLGADQLRRAATILEALPSGTEIAQPDLDRIIAIAQTSRALVESVTRHPNLLAHQIDPRLSITLQQRQALMISAGGELSGVTDLKDSTAQYSRFIDGIVDRTLESTRRDLTDRFRLAADLPFAVIAMGKWGANELNYYSDIDLIFVHGDLPADPENARKTGLALASRLLGNLTASTFDGPGLVVDADLRPEGTMGPLSRKIDAYSNYYDQWAEPWELQALLKARVAAGDEELGSEFLALASSVIWDTGLDVDELRGLRRIKAETEQGAAPDDIKRAPGGIRDIEFTVQMLQLVHGRHDATVRVGGTLEALEALQAGEYITGDERTELESAYRFLRGLEHRIQLWDLRQTHRLPSDETDRLRLAKSLDFSTTDEFAKRLTEVRAAARTLHERIYFRPVLESLVGSPSARLGPDRAGERLAALGFGHTEKAADALDDLTRGLSRRSRAMQQMLPLILDWLSLSPNPDLGLSHLRLLLSNTPDHSALVSRLLDSPTTGERLAMLLGTGRLLASLIDRIPEFVPRLADDGAIDAVRDKAGSVERLLGLLEIRPDLDDRIGTIRRFSRRRRLRVAARDVLHDHPALGTIRSLSDTADASMIGAYRTVVGTDQPGFAIVAMGRWGGEELSYGSDLDVVYVFEDMDREKALEIPARLTQVLSEPGRHGVGYELDADIRPEGKKGPIARSVSSYARYFEDWAEPWERLALIRARPVTGAPDVMELFEQTKASILWDQAPNAEDLQSIRLIKARVETERIAPHEDADFHLKLGPGSLSDIEFLCQLLQLKHGHKHPELRGPATLDALGALRDLEHLTDQEHQELVASYEFCTRVRLRLHLQRGRLGDSLPTDPAELSSLASSLGYDRTGELREDFSRVTRRARRVYERRFFE